jgi:CRISPR-associated protein Csh1
MLKEIVEFSKILEDNKIYERILEKQKRIDKPIMVIPVKKDLSDFDVKDCYFVFKHITKENEEKVSLILDGENKEKKIDLQKANKIQKISIKELIEEDNNWANILLNLSLYTQKLSNDAKGGKSIGSNSGTNSYNLLAFEGKFRTGRFEDKNGTENYKGDLFFCKKGFFQKVQDTYREVNIKKGIPEDIDFISREKFIDLFLKFSNENILKIIWNEIDQLKNILTDRKKGKKTIKINNMFIVLKLPEEYYTTSNYYKEWYDKYLSKKVFKSNPPNNRGYPVGKCSLCKKEKVELWVPNAFNNLDGGKPYLLHKHRFSQHKIYICGDCCLQIYKFQEFFLNKLRITLFPLFINENYSKYTISLLKNYKKIEKLSFREVIKNVYIKSSQNELDYYLIIYKDDILSIDYITGFRYKFSNYNIFQLESIIDEFFFGDKLFNNYFTQKVNTGRTNINNLIYKYRQQYFDYFYRAKYKGIDVNSLIDQFLDTLRIQLKLILSGEEKIFVSKSIKRTFYKYLELDTIFKGVNMETINRIKKSRKINDKESFSYYAGQITYYLLSQSKSDNKTHGLVEPFLNITNFRMLGEKIEELFKNYKHAIPLNFPMFNKKISELWSFIYDNREGKFSKDLKILFYAGYFDSKENIFYQKSKEVKDDAR